MANNNRYHIRTQGPSQSPAFSFDQLDPLLQGHSYADAACPGCGPEHQGASAARKVLRLFRLQNQGVSFKCARCEEHGYVLPNQQRPLDPGELRAIRERQQRQRQREVRQRLGLVQGLWSRSVPVQGTLGEVYWRDVRKIACPLPLTMRFLRGNERHPASILLPFQDRCGNVRGLHVTKLNIDGSKIAKIMLGKDTVGMPLRMADAREHEICMDILIAEGPENALSMHQSFGITAWAAGSKDRLPALATAIPEWAEAVWVKPDVDADGGGLERARQLVEACRWRGFVAGLV
jgi:hypothetical protein